MSVDIIKELEILKGKIDAAKSNRSAIDAEIKWTMGKIKEDFDCDSLPEAKELLNQLLDESAITRHKLLQDYQELLKEVQLKGIV
jgi:hypothetical protein